MPSLSFSAGNGAHRPCAHHRGSPGEGWRTGMKQGMQRPLQAPALFGRDTVLRHVLSLYR